MCKLKKFFFIIVSKTWILFFFYRRECKETQGSNCVGSSAGFGGWDRYTNDKGVFEFPDGKNILRFVSVTNHEIQAEIFAKH